MNDIVIMVLVEPGFVPTELSLIQDVLRIANRLSQTNVFKVYYCTSCGQEIVEGLGGLLVRTQAISELANQTADYFIVLGGVGFQHRFDQLRFWIKSIERKGCQILLLSDAASEWKSHNPLDLNVTTHWENYQLLRDTSLLHSVSLPLYSRSKRFISSAGMMATADVVLNCIIEPHSSALAHGVSRVLLMNAIRTSDIDQPRSENDNTLLQKAGLGRVIQLMEDNLEAPLLIKELAEQTGCSIRQLERRFQKAVGCNPKAFYRALRLKRAKTLLEQTNMTILDIAVSLGFSSSASFSRLYALKYGVTPSRARVLR